ncbi:MAG: DHH family phosphoesterase [Clostridia bacterium]|nr:DHH family phosphoesterase [Clostridia bacterium]
MNDFNWAVSELNEQNEIIILTHANPDGDTLGCGYALMSALRNLGKRVMLLNKDRIPDKFGYMILDNDEVDRNTAYVVAVDVADKKLFGEELKNEFGDRTNLCIDHHPSNKFYADLTVLDGESAAASEVLYEFIKAMGAEITPHIATCLYTGISTDTGCFKYSNVTAKTHRIAAELIETGIDHSKINEIMFDTKSMNNLMLEKMCLETLEIFADGKAASVCVTQEMLRKSGTDKSAIDAIKPITRQIEGVEIGLTFKEDEIGAIGVSVRTSENYNASDICAVFGGGGHARAAGCQLKTGLDEAKSKVIETVKSFI